MAAFPSCQDLRKTVKWGTDDFFYVMDLRSIKYMGIRSYDIV